MRHSEIDKRSKRNRPRQCLADFGHNVYKDAPVREPIIPLPVDMSFQPLTELLDWVDRQKIVGTYGYDPKCFYSD